MKDEIKEILDKLKSLDYDEYNLEVSMDYIERKEEKLLLDCITNLQERNEKAINEVIRVLQIILEQPSKDKIDDLWIINKLEGIQTLLQGEDKDDTNSR